MEKQKKLERVRCQPFPINKYGVQAGYRRFWQNKSAKTKTKKVAKFFGQKI